MISIIISFIEDCLESENNNADSSELIQDVTLEIQDMIEEIHVAPLEKSPLGPDGYLEGQDLKESPVIFSQYHYHFGHCFTVDISSVSKYHGGGYPMFYGSKKMELHLKIKAIEFDSPLGNIMFIHNGTNINQFDQTISGNYWIRPDHGYDVSFI